MKNKILFLFFLTLLAGCSKEETLLDGKAPSSVPIQFSDASGITRGQTPLETNNLFTMGVFAGYEKETESFSSTSLANDFINNVRYTRSFITNPFAGDDVCYWPFSGKLSFFAYAPYISNAYLQFASDYVSGYPRLNYTPTIEVTNQPDLCIASPVLNQAQTTDAIPLVFNHALSQVLFYANYCGNLPPSSAKLYVKIDSIRVHHVIGRKVFTMSNGTPCFEWQDDSECTEADRVSYLLRRGGLAEQCHITDDSLRMATTPATDNYLSVSAANGRLYLLPQSMDDGDVYLTITYAFYEMVGSVEMMRARCTTTCNLPATSWLPAHSYRYKFTINLANNSVVNPTVTAVVWDDVNNTEIDPTHIE